MVYDTTDKESFQHVDSWLQEVNKYASENTVKVLVGNKSDKAADRAVNTEEGKKKADSVGLSFIETSAKDASHVEEAFQIISRQLVRNRDQISASQRAPPPRSGLNLGQAATEKINQCCSG